MYGWKCTRAGALLVSALQAAVWFFFRPVANYPTIILASDPGTAWFSVLKQPACPKNCLRHIPIMWCIYLLTEPMCEA